MISIVVAASENGVIGKSNKLPWHLPADLKHFKKLTMGHPIIMGRKTHESIGRALPGRKNIVVTHQKDYPAEGCEVVNSIEEALEECEGENEIFIIGGAGIYKECLEVADRIYLTRIHGRFDGDTKLFEIDEDVWAEVEREDFKPDEENRYSYSFLRYERR